MNMKRILRILRDSWYYRPRKQRRNVYDSMLGHEVKVMTYNVRCDSEDDGKYNWEYRKRCVTQVIRDERPSIVCLQELAPHTLKYLLYELGGDYDCYDVDARNGRPLHKNWFSGYGLAILYDKIRYSVVDEECFWLSDTPGKPSRTWGHKEYRIAIYMKLYDNYSAKYVNVFNTHFDHTSGEAIEKSQMMLRREIALCEGEIFVAGDFNADISSLDTLNEVLSNNITDNTPTFAGFRFEKVGVVDTIYTSKPYSRKVIVRKFNGYNASDHNAVVVKIHRTI